MSRPSEPDTAWSVLWLIFKQTTFGLGLFVWLMLGAILLDHLKVEWIADPYGSTRSEAEAAPERPAAN